MSRAVWVTRDADRWYKLHDYEPHVMEGDALLWDSARWILACAKDFERITGFRLKPGEGPVRVVITVKRVKKGA